MVCGQCPPYGTAAAGVVSLIRVPSMLNPYLLTIIAILSGLFVKVPLDCRVGIAHSIRLSKF
jgi:hypothetical protein